MNYDELNVALIQYDIIWEDSNGNRNRLENILKEIPSETDIVVLPEMFSTGFSMDVSSYAEPMDGDSILWMKEQSSLINSVIAGSIMISENGSFYNRFIFVFPTGNYEFYDKRHLFSMGKEDKMYVFGKERKIFKIKNFRILPQICYDLRFPVFSRNKNDYDVLINCANWPVNRIEVWKTLLKARAIENQSYVIGVNRIGKDGNNICYSGDSMVIDSKGKVMDCGTSGEQMVVYSKLSKLSLDRFRRKFPVLDSRDDFFIKK